MKITNKMRFMLIMLSVVMVLSLFACAETPEETTTKAPVETTEKPTETTEKTEPTEAPVDTDATDAPVVGETTDADVAETTESETESESESATTETGSETATEFATTETTETETTEAPACQHAETVVDDECNVFCADCGASVSAEKQHTPLDPNPQLGCNVICENCGEVLAAAQHVAGVPDAEDACNVYCENGCGTKLAENQHGEPVADAEDHCIPKCPTCKTVLGEAEHKVDVYTAYAATPDSNEAMIAGDCTVCGDAITKPASYFYAIETIYGNDTDENVVIFQADAETAPLMGSQLFSYADGHPNYPANGYAPIAPDCQALDGAFNGMLGISGWVTYLNSDVNDGAAFKILDAEGNVLVEWTAVQPLLGPNTNRNDVSAAFNLAEIYPDGATTPIGFSHIIDTNPYYGILNGKTVTIVLAFAPAQADGDYITYANISVVIPACDHVAGEIDTANNCTVSCTKCGAILEEGKHTLGEYAIDASAPQTEVAACVCGYKATREASKTLEGLVVYGPDALYAMKNNGGFKRSVVTDEATGLKYLRAISAKTGAEGNITVNEGTAPLENVGKYAFIIYRKNTGAKTIQFMANYHTVTEDVTKGRIEPSPQITFNEEFQILIVDISARIKDDKLGWFRVDIIDGTASTVDVDTIDIAAIGFAATNEDAYAYFNAYVAAYGINCQHIGDTDYASTGNVDEAKVTCKVCAESIVVACPHTDKTAVATDVPTVFNFICNICGKTGTTSSTNDQNLVMFDAQFIFDTAQNDGNDKYTTTLMKEGDLSFTRFQTIAAKGGVEYYYYPTDKAITGGLSNYFMIVYRASEGYGANQTVDIFVANSGGVTSSHNKGRVLIGDGEWKVAVYDLSATSGFNAAAGTISVFRFDIFDSRVSMPAGTYIDIAYMGFFETPDKAYENYFKAVELYGFESANYYNRFDGIYNDSASVRDNSSVTTKQDWENGTWSANFEGQTIASAKSVGIKGWVVTPGGAESISYRIVKADGTKSELIELVKPVAITSTNGIATATVGMTYGDGRLLGAHYQSKISYFDLTGYEGQTVTIEVYVITKNGQIGNLLNITNVTVPGTPAAE